MRKATYSWKAFNEGYKFALNLASIRALHKKLWAFKMVSLDFENFKTSDLESQGKRHLGVALVPNHK
jgi:hypothetical protein